MGVTDEVDLLPPDAVPGPAGRLRGALRERVGDTTERGALRSGEGGAVLQVEPRRARARRPARLRRARRQRAPPERLRVHGLAEPDGRRARPAHAERLGDPRARQHAGAVLAGAARGRGVRHARLHDRRPARRRLPGRHVDGRQPLLRRDADGDPAPLLRGPRPHHEGVDAARPVRLQRPLQQAALRQPVAAAVAEAAPARVARRRWLGRDVRDGRQQRLHVQLPVSSSATASPRR